MSSQTSTEPEAVETENSNDRVGRVGWVRPAVTATVTTFAMAFFVWAAIDPAAAATSVSTSDATFCDNAVMTTITSAISFFTVAGPTLGVLNAVWNMSKAASTNKSNKKKEAKENVQDSLKYGLGAGAITAILGLFTSWGPFAVCAGSGLF